MIEKIVYLFPSCASKVMSFNDHSMTSKIIKILQKLSYKVEVINLNNDCCGLMYCSMGYDKTANKKRNHLLTYFSKAIKQNHSAVILIENSSCIFEIYSKESENPIIKRIFDPISFLYEELKDYHFKKSDKKILLHINCSITNLNKNKEMLYLAHKCTNNVIIPNDILCCGFAGSKGFSNPELNQNALKTIKEFIPEDCKEGYTCLETCALGLEKYSGIKFYSLFHLIYDCMI